MKKIISLILIFILVLSTNMIVFANEKEGFAPDTKITENNLNSILEYYGLDPSTIRTDIDTSKIIPITTVAELEKTLKSINEMKKQAFSNLENEENYGDNSISSSDVFVRSMLVNGVIRLSSSSLITSSWGITGECDANYAVDVINGYKRYTGVANPNVRLYSPWYLWLPGVTNSLDYVYSISASYTASKVTLSYSVRVGTYAIIGIGEFGIPITVLLYNTNVSGSKFWGTSFIPN